MAMTFDTDVTVNGGKVLKCNTINAPTASGGSTYGVGSIGQVLKSNGTTVYWGDTAEAIEITKNTDQWVRNYTTAFHVGKLVIVNVYVTGTVTVNTTICTGLPAPNSAQSMFAIGGAVSIDTMGKCYVSSLGSGINTACTIVYWCYTL